MFKRNALTLIAVLVLTIGTASLAAQTAELTGEPLLRALLQELRDIRLSMQKNAAYELRGRLLIDRARLHQETIRELSREVESQNEALRSSEPMDISYDMEMETSAIEARGVTIPNPEERRKMIERHKEMMERRREMHARHIEQMRVRQQRMEQRLNDEREKLQAIEAELEEIQADLTGATR
jgi:chromosome segregation ATPase